MQFAADMCGGSVVCPVFADFAVRLLPFCLVACALALSPVAAALAGQWTAATVENLQTHDDDLARHADDPEFLDGLRVRENRFNENGFDWHLIRFESVAKPDGPLWMVPHDDENAAFDAMIAAIKAYGGVGIAVNSGPGSSRMMRGNGLCGVRRSTVSLCDPNRNFDSAAPLYTAAFLDQRSDGQPVIALHTNSHGFSGDGGGGQGQITILDRDAYRRGEIKPRSDGLLAVGPQPVMANYDTLGLTAYLASSDRPDDKSAACGRTLANSGIHFWHERVGNSDGSMSNYLILNHPDIRYFNAESRVETDLSLAASRHMIMIAAYLGKCLASGDQPTP
jgi:hypothetical protein